MFVVNKISASELNQFNQCSQKWLYRKLGAPFTPVDDSAARFGTEVHHVVANYLESLSEDTTEDKARRLIERYFSETPAAMSNAQKLRKIKDNFIKLEIQRLRANKRKKPTLIEKRLEVDIFPNVLLVGVIDYYDQETATIIDWKTGRPGNFTDAFLVQGKIYETLVKKAGLPVEKVFFVNLVDGSKQQLPKVTDGWLEEKIRSMCENVRLNNFGKNPTGLCGWCEYRLCCELEGYNLWQEPLIVKSVIER